MMPSEDQANVFLSYASKDASTARDIYSALTNAGFDVWFDEACIVPGARWDTAIKDELEKAEVMILLIGSGLPGNCKSKK